MTAAMLGGDDAGNHGERGDPASMLSVKEERDLHTLLGMFAMGVGDVDHFQARLQDELAALEVAVVVVLTYTLLASPVGIMAQYTSDVTMVYKCAYLLCS